MSKKIEQSLNINPLVPTENNVPEPKYKDSNVEDDLNMARDGLIDAFEKSRHATDDLIGIAQQSQHPRAYEALNAAIKTLADISGDLADYHMKKDKIIKKGDPSEQQGTVNNNLFVGSTKDILAMLQNNKTEEE